MSNTGNRPTLPAVSERVSRLHARMTLPEKLAQLVGYWVDKSEDKVAPLDGEFAAGDPVDLIDENGHILARGLVNYDATELPALLGRSTHDLTAALAEQARSTVTGGLDVEDAYYGPLNNTNQLARVSGFLSRVPAHA